MTNRVQATKRVRLAQRRKRQRLIKLSVLMIAGVLFFTASIWGLSQEWATINKVTINGNNRVSNKQIESVVATQLAGLRAYGLYKGTILTYNEAELIEALKYQYPLLENVQIKIRGINELSLEVVEREPIALWCASVECYEIDKEGYIFNKLNGGGSAPKLVEYSGGLAGDALRQHLLPNDFTKVQAFVSSLINNGLKAVSVYILPDEGELRVKSLNYPELRVKIDDNLEKVLEYLEITLASADYKDYVSEVGTVEYIDLRFGNRVYYK